MKRGDNHEGDEDFVRVRDSHNNPNIGGIKGVQVVIEDDGSNFHATPRSRKLFYEQ
jgi:hypothetical protein